MAGHPQEQVDTKAGLLAAAVSLFAVNGFDGTTVRDIADKAGVNISLVSYHFGGKQGIYEACLSGFHEQRLESIQRILQPPEGREDFVTRLRLHFEEVLIWYVDYPEIMQMIHREVDRGTPIVEDLFKDVFMKALGTVQDFLKVAKKKGIIASHLDPKIISHLMGSTVHQIGRGDHLAQKFFNVSLADKKYRSKMVDHLVWTIVDGIAAK